MASEPTTVDHQKRLQQQALERLKAELSRAFAEPECNYAPLTALEVIRRNRE